MFLSTAFAQGAGQVAAKPGIGEMLFPMAVIVFIFYFLIGRPQQKKAKEAQAFQDSLKRGDEIITSSGIFGEITGMTDQFVTLQIADNVRVKILRSQIARLAKEPGAKSEGGR